MSNKFTINRGITYFDGVLWSIRHYPHLIEWD